MWNIKTQEHSFIGLNIQDMQNFKWLNSFVRKSFCVPGKSYWSWLTITSSKLQKILRQWNIGLMGFILPRIRIYLLQKLLKWKLYIYRMLDKKLLLGRGGGSFAKSLEFHLVKFITVLRRCCLEIFYRNIQNIGEIQLCVLVYLTLLLKNRSKEIHDRQLQFFFHSPSPPPSERRDQYWSIVSFNRVLSAC